MSRPAADAEAATRRAGSFQVLRHRDFALLWLGQSVSALGDGIFTIALVIEVLRVDHRPTGLAYVLAARIVPSVAFSIVGGVVADRVPRRVAMLASDLVRGMAVGTIALLIATHHDNLVELVAMSIVFGIADSFFGPAAMSLLPELLPPELLARGNGLSSTSSNLASGLLGPATGGTIVAFLGLAGSFTADAVSFAVSVLSLLLMSARPRPAPSGKSPMAEAREGLSYIRSRRWLLVTLVMAGLANFFGIAPLEVLVSLLLRHVLHVSALTLGLVFAAGGAAGVVASLVVARLGSPQRRVKVMWAAYSLSGAAIALMAAAPDAVVVGVLSAAEIGLIVYGDVLYVTMMQELVPNEIRGRVFSAAFLVAFVLTPLGTVLGGVAAVVVGTREAILLSGILSGACCLVVLVPGVGEPPAEEQQPAA